MTVYVPPAIIGGTAFAVTCATYAACARTGSGMLGGNQDTPSFTSAKRCWYCAGSFGTMTLAVIVFATVGATSPPSGVRTPSHATTTFPVASYQWYVRSTGVEPPAFQVWLPVFVSVTGIWSAAPAGAACGAAPAATA